MLVLVSRPVAVLRWPCPVGNARRWRAARKEEWRRQQPLRYQRVAPTVPSCRNVTPHRGSRKHARITWHSCNGGARKWPSAWPPNAEPATNPRTHRTGRTQRPAGPVGDDHGGASTPSLDEALTTEEPRQLELVADGGVFVVHDPGPSARDEINRLRTAGYGWTAIARALNTNGVPTPSGRGVWHHGTVQQHANPSEWAAYIAGRRRAKRGTE